MITNLQFYQGTKNDPYENLALESFFLQNNPPDTCICYLWQNQKTVVIGKNQNAWRECSVELLESEGGRLARRLSGGGAVFHDLGNLNFTFIAPLADYSVSRQLDVICRAVEQFGLSIQKSGRNDLLANGRKFSGNAFQKSRRCGCHHGTLLVDTDLAQMSRYLTASAEKLQSKGVSSVKSRVVNLKDLCPSITIERLSQAILYAFGQVYGLSVQSIPKTEIDWERVRKKADVLSSWQWRYGKDIPFSFELSHRFFWGEILLRFVVNSGRTVKVQVFSDAMDTDFIERIPVLLQDLPVSFSAFAEALSPLAEKPQYASMAIDLQRFLKSSSQIKQGDEIR